MSISRNHRYSRLYWSWSPSCRSLRIVYRAISNNAFKRRPGGTTASLTSHSSRRISARAHCCAPFVAEHRPLPHEVCYQLCVASMPTTEASSLMTPYLNIARRTTSNSRSCPYRKNEQAWVEQKNGSVVRRLVGYRRLEGIAGAEALSRFYTASRLFGNFFLLHSKLRRKRVLAPRSRSGPTLPKRPLHACCSQER